MKIGIIGAGWVGRTIAKLALANGHDVMISNSRTPETLLSTGSALGCKVGTAGQAAAFGDIVVVAVPMTALAGLPEEQIGNKIVIDANNYYHERDGRIPELDAEKTTTSELLSRQLPDARIVKAFNSIRMVDLESQGTPSGSADRWAIPIAGNDGEAKQLVAGLMDAFGFDPFDAGPLAEGWRFERDRPVYCQRLTKGELSAKLASTERTHALTGAQTRRPCMATCA